LPRSDIADSPIQDGGERLNSEAIQGFPEGNVVPPSPLSPPGPDRRKLIVLFSTNGVKVIFTRAIPKGSIPGQPVAALQDDDENNEDENEDENEDDNEDDIDVDAMAQPPPAHH